MCQSRSRRRRGGPEPVRSRLATTRRRALEPLVPLPENGRVFRSSRRIRLSDRAADGRLRLDAVARYLQDAASDDVDETDWGAPEHLWVVRHLRIDIVVPPVDDDRVELATWSSGTGTVAAGRRLSLLGDRGGQVELDSVWIHLGSDARPARIEGFGVYAEAAGERIVSTKLELPEPPPDSQTRRAWPLRLTDVDRLGHINNAVYWHAVEELLADLGPNPQAPLRARLDHRHAIDLGDPVELAAHADGGVLSLAFVVGSRASAVALVEPG